MRPNLSVVQHWKFHLQAIVRNDAWTILEDLDQATIDWTLMQRVNHCWVVWNYQNQIRWSMRSVYSRLPCDLDAQLMTDDNAVDWKDRFYCAVHVLPFENPKWAFLVLKQIQTRRVKKNEMFSFFLIYRTVAVRPIIIETMSNTLINRWNGHHVRFSPLSTKITRL